MLTLAVKPQWVRYKLDETIEKPCSGYAGKLRWQTTGMCGEAMMAESWEGVGEAAMAKTHKTQERASGGVRCSHWR
jgi:hypothetical protein